MNKPATRIITLIQLLQRRPNQKAGDLAAELGVSVRTLHRYIAMLDELGLPVFTERGPNGGFSLVRGYRMPPLIFTPEEAAALTLGAGLAADVWGSLYRQAALAALAKLENVLPQAQRDQVDWARQTLLVRDMHRIDPQAASPWLEILSDAIRKRRQVELLYRSSHTSEPIHRRIDPYVLVHRSGWRLVIGYCHLRQSIRTFRLDRILEIKATNETFAAPEAIDPDEYLQIDLKNQPPVKVSLRFLPQAAHLARYQQNAWGSFNPTFFEEPGGSLLVTLHTPDLQWAASMAISFGPLVEALEPQALRQMLAEWAQTTLSVYQ